MEVDVTHTFAVIATATVFLTGIALMSYGLKYALICLFLAVLSFTYTKKLEEDLLKVGVIGAASYGQKPRPHLSRSRATRGKLRFKWRQ